MKILNVVGIIAIAFSPMCAMSASLMSADVNRLQSASAGEDLSELKETIKKVTAQTDELEQKLENTEQEVADVEKEVAVAEKALEDLKGQAQEKVQEPTIRTKFDLAIKMSQIDLKTATDKQQTVAAMLIATKAKYDSTMKILNTYKEQLASSDKNCIPGRNGKLFCRVIKETERDEETGEVEKVEAFADLGLSPTLADGGELKLGLLRGYVDLGENFKVPFVVAIADVTSQTEPSEANAAKLLDPDQGINIGQEYAWRYHILGLCAGENTTADCRLGFNWGARYMKLQQEGETESQGTFGAFSTLQTGWSFNIFDMNNAGNKLGTIRLYAAYSQFFHDGKNSSDYFAGVTDNDGNPVSFDRNFASFKYGASIYINESINITYSKFNAVGANGVMDNESYTLNFDVLKF